MPDITIPEEAQRAAIEAMTRAASEGPTVMTMRAVEAAAPLIVASYLEQRAGDTNCLDDHDLLVAMAAELRDSTTGEAR